MNNYELKVAALSAEAQACSVGNCEVEVNPVVYLSLSRTVLKSWADELTFSAAQLPPSLHMRCLFAVTENV